MAASTVALLSTIGLIVVLSSGDDSAQLESAGLADKVVKLEANEEFYLGLKKKLEDENRELTKERKDLELKNESLSTELASKESRSMSEIQELRDELSQTQRDLSEAKDDLVRAQQVTPAQPVVKPSVPVETSKSKADEILAWAKRNTTLVFPCAIKVTKQTVTLQDYDKLAKIPVSVGGALRATQFHPKSPDGLIVYQPVGNKFYASMHIANSNFVEAVKPLYEKYAKGAGSVGTPMANPLAPKPAVRLSSQIPSSDQPAKVAVPASLSGEGLPPKIAKGRPKGPQQPEDILDRMPSKPSADSKKKPDLSDHGANCVCKDCRASKIGKGGSLFPDL